jgi:maltose alpha-D-glucosyltransferase / alpha-amylase
VDWHPAPDLVNLSPAGGVGRRRAAARLRPIRAGRRRRSGRLAGDLQLGTRVSFGRTETREGPDVKTIQQPPVEELDRPAQPAVGEPATAVEPPAAPAFGAPAAAPVRSPELVDPQWYKDAVIYELHVRAFFDSDGDGMGDFRGLTAKLDYLQDLGVTALWLLPFYPSPWRDDGYDISDYTSIHEAYGTLKDFKIFLREAHKRGLKVITELVVNHTSDQHPWFQRARRAEPGSRAREFYVWSDSPERYADARIIFKDFETSNWAWDPVAKAYYWHRFFSHQPDLNYADERVHKALFQALDFWLDLGVDGVRLDAVPYLYEREGTNCENLPETHGFLKQLRAHVDARHPGRMLLAEANQWPEDAIAYFGEGDECHMAFHFPVMPRLFMAIRMEDRFPVVDILQQTPPIPPTCQWATFLRNHDELTLEMVTDEDRDYMYRVYAQDPKARINLGIRRRLAPLLGHDRRRIELMNGLLFALPGTPVLYYGDEIGMGDNFHLGDRNGVRTPMQWSADRNAGFSRANPQRLYLPVIIDSEYHYEAINVEAQHGNPHSLLWWTKRLIALRRRYHAFGRGTLELLAPRNRRVLAFLRRFGGERILVVANLSRFAQHAELDLSEMEGATPVELFGRTRFPRLGRAPWPLTLGPHGFYWFALERSEHGPGAPREVEAPVLAFDDTWEDCFEGSNVAVLEEALPDLLQARSWFAAGDRTLRGVRIAETIPLDDDPGLRDACLALLEADHAEGDPETWALPLAFATGERALQLRRNREALYAHLEGEEVGVLVDALADRGFCSGLLEAIVRRRRFRGEQSELVAFASPAFREEAEAAGVLPEPAGLHSRGSKASVVFGDRCILKLFRRLEPGVNPDLEIGRFLTERAAFPHTPAVLGGLEIRRGRVPFTLAILRAWVENEGNAWSYTQDALGRYFERVLADGSESASEAVAHLGPAGAELGRGRHLVDLAAAALPDAVCDLLGTYVPAAELLGRRTAELHLALASAPDLPDFAPEPFTALHQRSLYQSLRSAAGRTFELLSERLESLPPTLREEAATVLAARDRVLALFGGLLAAKIPAVRIRTHGDYHLGQVLYTGRDFAILDFEGDPARPFSERRLKRSPLRDVAGMVRSFHAAAATALREEAESGVVPASSLPALESWAETWERWASAAFLRTYLATLDSAAPASLASTIPLVPRDRRELALLLDVYLLEKALAELSHELIDRPGRAWIPLRQIRQILDREE